MRHELLFKGLTALGRKREICNGSCMKELRVYMFTGGNEPTLVNYRANRTYNGSWLVAFATNHI